MRNDFLQAQWYTGEIEFFARRRVIAEREFAVTYSQGEIASILHAL